MILKDLKQHVHFILHHTHFHNAHQGIYLITNTVVLSCEILFRLKIMVFYFSFHQALLLKCHMILQKTF